MMTPEEKRHDMLHSPVELLVCKMAVPTIITMLITALYNMADTYFVGRLDTVSTAAVGLALPLMNVIQAIGFFFGHGSGNYMARKLGEGDVNWDGYIKALNETGYKGFFTIERECGADPTADIKLAVAFLKKLLGQA